MPPKSSKKSSRTPANPPHNVDTHDMRRFLAERVGTDGEPEYLVDWVPTWERKANIEESATTILQEWEDIKAEQKFQFGHKTVVRCMNASADSSPEHMLLMRQTVFEHFQNKVLQDRASAIAYELFWDDDWVFKSDKYRERAEEDARSIGKSRPSAAEVVRRTYITIRGRPLSERSDLSVQDEDLPYRAIRVRFVGQVDLEITTAPDMEMRTASSVINFLIPLFNENLRRLKDTWKLDTAHEIALQISETIAKFSTHAPYLLRDPLLLMFTRLFLMSDETKESLDKVGITVGDNWHDHSQDHFLWTYCGDWEKRPIDCVERTYMATRDEVRWYVENACDENGEPIVENGSSEE